MRHILSGKTAFLAVVTMVISLGSLAVSCAGSSIVYSRLYAAGVPVHVISIDMADLNVKVYPTLALNGAGHSESWSRMINRVKPTAAITGTYFDTHSLYPTGDIVIDGSLACWGTLGTGVCIGWNNEVSFVPVRRGSTRDWSEYHHVIVAGPLLVWDGHVSVNPRSQGFRDAGIFASRPRTAIGVTAQNRLLMVVSTRPIHLRRLGMVMQSLRCVQAAALDGGTSCGLYYRGKTIVKPGRRMTNLLLAYES